MFNRAKLHVEFGKSPCCGAGKCETERCMHMPCPTHEVSGTACFHPHEP